MEARRDEARRIVKSFVTLCHGAPVWSGGHRPPCPLATGARNCSPDRVRAVQIWWSRFAGNARWTTPRWLGMVIADMSRMPIPTHDEAPKASQPLLDVLREKLGFVPNVFRIAAHSPHALAGLSALHEAVHAALDEKLRGQIALAVSQVNGSRYCLAAHTYWGQRHGLSAEEMELNRRGKASDTRSDAVVCFAAKVAELRGDVSDHDYEAVRAAGFSDAEILEIVATSVYYLFTNFINNALKTDIDPEFIDDEVMRHGP
jgi:uncharacterized peroxidase-related enzyme